MMKKPFPHSPLYAICDLGYLTLDQALPVSERLLRGGARILQLRAKGHEPEDLVTLAKALKTLCQVHHAHFVINDHPQLAKACHADTLHLGQEDGSLAEVKKELGEFGELITYGRSTHSPEQAAAALKEGFDYIGFGPLFPTPTKAGRAAIGLGDLREVQESIGKIIPVYGIGGVNPETLSQVLEAGGKNVVVVSHLLQHPEPAAETAHLLSLLS